MRWLVAMLVCLVGCQKGGEPLQRVLRLNVGEEPETVDPGKARTLTQGNLAKMLYEGLTRVGPDGKLELALAEEAEVSGDGKRVVFRLRESVWANGEKVTAEDFVRSWERVLDPAFPAGMAYQFYVIKGAKERKNGEDRELGIYALDARTLVVELENPTPYFLELVGMPCFFPVCKEGGVGNGPFEVEEWRHGDAIYLKKNKRYWQEEVVKLEGIELMMVANETERMLFDEGQLDWLGSPFSSLPIDAMGALRERKEFRVQPAMATYFLRVNTEKVGDAAFRRFLSSGIDREAIVEHVLQGGQRVAMQLLPPELGAKKWKKTREEEPGVVQNVVISYASVGVGPLLAQTLQQEWQVRLGLKVDLEAVEPSQYYKKISQGDYQVAISSWFADFQDPINFLEVFKYKWASTNNTGWENPKYVDLLTRAAVCRDTKERKDLLDEAAGILAEEMPIIPLYHSSLSYLQTPKLCNVVFSPLGQIDFRWAYFIR